MANIIDALFVTLGLDASGFVKGAKDAEKAQEQLESKSKSADSASTKRNKDADAANKKRRDEEAKAAKQREAEAKKAAEALGKIRNEVLAISASFIGLSAIKGFAENIIGADTALKRVSGALGESASTLNAWEVASSKFGASAEDTEGAFRNTLKLQQELKEGNIASFQPFVQTLASKGVQFDAAKLFDRNLSAQERQLELSKIAAQLSEKDAVIALEKLGYSEKYAQFLHSGAASIQESVDAARKLRPDLDAAAAESEKISIAWISLKQKILGVGESILLDIGPAIENVQKWFGDLADFAQDHIKATEVVVGSLTAAITALGIALSLKGVGGVLGFIRALSGIAPAATEAGAAVSGGLISSLTALASNTALLAAAGSVGYAIGTAIYKSIENTDTADKIGGTIANILAKFGDKDAQEAIDKNLGRKLSANEASAIGFKKGLAQNSGKPAAAISTSAATGATSGGGFDALQAAKISEQKFGVPASVTYAQYLLESGGGKHMPEGSNNPFGIKAKAGQPYVEAMTTEVIDGVEKRVMQKFAKFDSLQDAFDAHAKLLATSSYYKKAQGDTNDPNKYAEDLQGVYATDTKYASKLKRIIADVTAPGAPLDRALQTGAAASANMNNTSNTTQNTHQVETHIENVNINAPNAKTNQDVASAFVDKFQNYSFGSMANYGLTS